VQILIDLGVLLTHS